jgi:3-deoxy-D-manno-octulosonic-acid transferase
MGRYEIPIRPAGERRVWIHAVSVGEVMAAIPILRELRARQPDLKLVLSVTTSSGHETARTRADGLYDHLVYFPIDVARFQLAAMQRVRPEVVAVMETELWFNFLWAADVFGARKLLINGRISDRSYPRSLKLRPFYRSLLGMVDRCAMQTQTDAERILALGAKSADVMGNSKFDGADEAAGDADTWRRDLGLVSEAQTVVFGSVRAEEFGLVAPAVSSLLRQGVQVVVAPRHIERTDELASALAAAGVTKMGRRAQGQGAQEGLLVLDSYGELSSVYAVADVVVVGGGFAQLGGQNILQPLALGKAVVFGPHMHNFRDVVAEASAGAAVQTHAEGLLVEIERLLADDELRRELGSRARTLITRHTGASARYAQLIADEGALADAR